MNLMSWYRSGVLSNIDQGFCPTLAMACEAYEPHFVYKPRCPLHPLELSVFVLSIQSIRLVDSLTLQTPTNFPVFPSPSL
jgi:hypothetical protein